MMLPWMSEEGVGKEKETGPGLGIEGEEEDGGGEVGEGEGGEVRDPPSPIPSDFVTRSLKSLGQTLCFIASLTKF